MGSQEGSFTYNFSAHEESIKNMHDRIINLEKDILGYKEKSTEEN
jgi:hypothetical protein